MDTYIEVTKVGDRKLLIRDPKGHGRGQAVTSRYRGGLGTYIWDPHHYAAHSVTNTLLHYHSLDLLATNGGIDQYNCLDVISFSNTFNDFTFNCFDGFLLM